MVFHEKKNPVNLRACMAAVLLHSCLPDGLHGLDCNENGVPDAIDIVPAFDLQAGVNLPRSLVPMRLADLDGNLLLDLITAVETLGAHSIVVHLQTRVGRFEALVPVPLSFPTDIAVTDVDEDGHLDVLVTTYERGQGNGRVWVLRNDGSGSVSTLRIVVPRDLLVTPLKVVPLHADLDGHIDLAVVNGEVPHMSVFFGDGKGDFPREEPRDAGKGLGQAVAADFDRDGDVDLAAASDSLETGMVVFTNDGNGTFEKAFANESLSVSALLAADLDGDERVDLAAARQTPDGSQLVVFWNDGNGPAAFSRIDGPGFRGLGVELTAVDLDSNSGLEMALASWPDEVVVYSFDAQRELSDPRTSPVEAPPVGVAGADLDASGAIDMVVSSNAYGSVFLRNRGDGALANFQELGVEGSDTLLAARLNPDGHVDLAISSNDGRTVSIHPGGPDGVFMAPSVFTELLPDYVKVTAFRARDVDLDGDDDLWILGERLGGGGGMVAVLSNDGEGRMGKGIVRDIDIPGAHVLGDLGGEGFPDLAIAHIGRNSPDVLYLLRGRGDGTLEDPLDLRFEGRAHHLDGADLDGDGDLDIVAQVSAGALFALRNDGDWTFVPVQVGGFDRAASNIAVADFDGDGDQDLLLVRHLDIVLLENHGGLSFESRQPQAAADPHKLSANLRLLPMDLDGDLDIDMAMNGVTVFLNQGDGRFDWIRYDARRDPLVAADVDGDRDLDLLTNGRGELVLMENRTTPAFSRDQDRNGIPDECEAALFHRGDSNSDGSINIADPIYTLNHLFGRGPYPACREAADSDNDGTIAIADALMVLEYILRHGRPMPLPGPVTDGCGKDMDAPGSGGDIGCDEYAPCEGLSGR